MGYNRQAGALGLFGGPLFAAHLGTIWGLEGTKMEPQTHRKRSCEAKRAEEERKSALDNAQSDDLIII